MCFCDWWWLTCIMPMPLSILYESIRKSEIFWSVQGMLTASIGLIWGKTPPIKKFSLYIVWENTSFHWPVFSRIRTESLCGRIRVSEYPYSRIFCAVKIIELEKIWRERSKHRNKSDIMNLKNHISIHIQIKIWTWYDTSKGLRVLALVHPRNKWVNKCHLPKSSRQWLYFQSFMD